MRVAIPLWQGRISPVFDEASRILLVDIIAKREQGRHEQALISRNPFERAQMLPKLGVELVICGMISHTQQAALASSGIRIIPHICGSMEEVVQALLDGRLEAGALRMPGCGSRRRHGRGKMHPKEA